jgi:bis(5'-nucleosyl)-tetraphosphatase (symmetrical)
VQPIFVGDVQGCDDEFAELLARAEARYGGEFELWSVGDLINRGPENRGPLARVRELEERGRARVVLGNHEISLLRSWLGLREISEFDSFQDLLEAPDAEEWMDWIRTRPLVCTGRLGEQPFAMVHASAHPSWSLGELERAARQVEQRMRAPIDELRQFLADERSDAADLLGRLTRARSVDQGGAWSAEEPAGKERAWHEAWSDEDHDYGIVYGHWAMQGLHVAPALRGLDTGCVHHGRGRAGALTGWIPDLSRAHPFDLPDEGFWSVRARRAYYAHRDAPGSA